MIIVPTRELMIQIDRPLIFQSMKIFQCSGGAPINRRFTFATSTILLSVPGRLKDLINRKMIFPNEFADCPR